MNSRMIKQLLLASVAGVSLASGAHAQDAASPDSAVPEQASATDGADTQAEVGEIMVTATRRSERLRDIPVSIAAFGGEKINQSGIFDVTQLDRLAAGMQVSTNYGGYQRITVRGIGSNQTNPGGNPSVAVHRDGVYLQTNPDFGMGFFDVDRIEVLRGPQGTLYGRNATGGAVNIITGSPTPDFHAGGTVSIGNYGLVETEGFASGPVIGDDLTGRIAFKTRKDTGYLRNIFNGQSYNGSDFAGVRGKLRYDAGDNFSVDLSGDYNRDDAVGLPYFTRARTNVPQPAELAGLVVPSFPFVNMDYTNRRHAETWGGSANIRVGLGFAELKSLTAYRKYNLSYNIDSDGQPLDLSHSLGTENFKQLSEELTLTSTAGGNLKWVAGLFYFHIDDMAIRTLAFPQRGTAQVNNIPSLGGDAYGIFGEASYQIIPSLALTVGGRYSYEKKSISQTQTFAGTASVEDLKNHWGDFSPKVALVYTVSPQVNVYATVSRGFKAGAYNGYALQGKAVDPETVTNYEIGIKNSFFGGRLRSNLSLFKMDYKNLQVSIFQTNPLTGASTAALANAATATIKGAEFDFDAKISDSLSIYGNGSYLDAKIKRWTNAIDPARGSRTFDVSGNRLPYAPRWAINAGAAYTVPISGQATATLSGEWAYKSRVFFSPFQDAFLSQKAYGLWNARLSFEGTNKKWSLAFWGKNLTNRLVQNDALENYSAISGSRTTRFPLAPRTYGASVGYKF
ncbi:MAG: TonB-dependent receptor [Sphingobium sp.]